jgi:hypothetical protein
MSTTTSPTEQAAFDLYHEAKDGRCPNCGTEFVRDPTPEELAAMGVAAEIAGAAYIESAHRWPCPVALAAAGIERYLLVAIAPDDSEVGRVVCATPDELGEEAADLAAGVGRFALPAHPVGLGYARTLDGVDYHLDEREMDRMMAAYRSAGGREVAA